VKIELHPRLSKHAKKLPAADRNEIVAALQTLAQGFGQPYLHTGLGIRRHRRNLFECRAGLHWRIIFFAEEGLLSAYDVMTHDEVKVWLRNF
jgi:mRNA-degrading endonuclease RelE of RelBE toxin-antitoxin system